MPDSIEKIIYKLEIDDSGYIRGVESLSASTNKFSQIQEQANVSLKKNETALKLASDANDKAKQKLDNYTGTNQKYLKQLETDVKKTSDLQAKLTLTVNDSRTAYEKATKAASDFANTSAKAANSQPIPGQGRIPVVPPIAPNPLLNQIRGATAQGALGLGDLPSVIKETIPEFETLRTVIGSVEAHMATLNTESEEFKLFSPIVAQAKDVLAQYDKAAQGAGEKTLSLKGQLRQAKEELVKLEQAGKGGTKAYADLELKTAKLTDAFADQQQRIKILASDTRALDFGKAAITGATAAFSTYTSISILAGGESEELQKKTLQLFAAMQLLTSLEQLSNLVRREGIIGLNIQSAAQATYTAVVGASTGALKTFRLALLASGIGIVVIGIGLLIKRYLDLKEATANAAEKAKLFKEINEEAAKSVGDQAAKLELYKRKLNDLSIPESERIKFAKEYNKVADETNKLDLKQISNLDLINLKIGAQTKLIIQRAVSTAALSKLTAESTKVIDAQLELDTALRSAGKTEEEITKRQGAVAQKEIDQRNKQITSLDGHTSAVLKNVSVQDKSSVTNVKNLTKEEQAISGLIFKRDLAVKSQQDLAKQLTAFIIPEAVTTKDPKAAAAKKEIDNVFIQERDKLNAQLSELNSKAAEDELAIRKEFGDKLIVEQNRIQKLLDDKQLKPGSIKDKNSEAGQLFNISKDINKTELDKALADFNKKVLDARKKLNDELTKLQQKNNQDTLNLIQDEFTRRAALIDLNEKQEIQNAKDATTERLESLQLSELLLGEQVYQNAKAVIVSEGEIEVNNIIANSNNKRKDLAADVFVSSLETLETALDESLLQLDETTTGKIQEQKALLASGAINYEEFQKRITKILADQKKERDKLRLQELNTELAQINKRLKTVTNAEEKNDLEKRQRSARKKISDINAEVPKEEKPTEVTTVAEYVEAIGKLTDSIIQFWQKANEAEAKALDTSISLQEKRVEAAQRIADRGNASYLKAEEDRLTQLNVQRENAARKQLGIDAALQASQILVGITGAISKIVSSPFGAETIEEIAIIIGALATGFGLVKSLQGNQPRLAKGDTYVSRGNNKPGVDTIPAWLNEGEAVIPTDKNKAYHPTVKAIYNGTIPAEHLNKFVTTYHKIKPVPQPNYERIKDAAELHISSDGKMAILLNENNKKLDESNDLQRQTLRAMRSMSVSANIDRDGVAIMVNEYISQMNIDKKI